MWVCILLCRTVVHSTAQNSVIIVFFNLETAVISQMLSFGGQMWQRVLFTTQEENYTVVFFCGQMATLGSQEGAFENVRMNYSGDQGQTIRQLITSHVLRRVGMCALTSPNSRRQHLAICSEKGKVTILQLSALLRQAHSTKRKLTLTVSDRSFQRGLDN